MTIETKEVRQGEYPDYLKFGWQFSQTTKHRGRTCAILIRNTDMPHYQEIKVCENKYMTAKSQLLTYERPDSVEYGLLYLLFIIPGIIFTMYQNAKKKDIEEHNARLRKTMSLALSKLNEIKSANE